MGNLAFGHRHHCFVLVQGKNQASDEEWGQWVAFVGQGGLTYGPKVRVFVFSAGGSPTPKQRKMIHQLMPAAGGGVLTAIVIDSRIARTVVTTMSLFNPGVRAFSPHEVGAACDYLGIIGAMRSEVLELARHQHERLSLAFVARL